MAEEFVLSNHGYWVGTNMVPTHRNGVQKTQYHLRDKLLLNLQPAS